MSAEEIKRLVDLRNRVRPEHWQAVVLWPEHWEEVKYALFDYAAMVERCESCGNVLDRDYNAAVNIRDEGMRIFTEGHSESACGGR